MTIRCECDHCGTSLKVKDKLAGTEGKCPKCREKIQIPDASSDDSEDAVLGDDSAPPQPDGPKKSAQEEEEDAIFGDDFFSMEEAPPRPRYVAPVTTDDDDDPPAPRKQQKPKVTDTEVGAEIESGSGGNASSIASSLLSKTGKRNRPDEFKDPGKPEDEGYDYSEVNYLLLNRILPAIGAAVILFSFFYWLFSGMMGDDDNLPELAELRGRVTNNGEGVVAQLMFLPNVNPSGSGGGVSGSSSTALSNADGTYEVFYKDDIVGLVVGDHEVRINAGAVRLTREITIEPGSQEINFELAE
jgi:hypothetical protein